MSKRKKGEEKKPIKHIWIANYRLFYYLLRGKENHTEKWFQMICRQNLIKLS